METHIFKLLTGLECEIKPVTGEDQAIFTNKKNIENGTYLDKFLSRVVVRIGKNDNITENNTKELLSGDRRKILFEIRQFENDFEEVFEFNYEFEVNGKKETYPVRVNLKEVKEKPYMVYDNHSALDKISGWISIEDYISNRNLSGYEDYSSIKELLCEEEIELPTSGQKVILSQLDGFVETKYATIDPSKININTELEMRTPKVVEEGKEKSAYPSLNVSKAYARDLRAIRKYIKEMEGDIDTKIKFSHVGQDVEFDIMHITDFLFQDIT